MEQLAGLARERPVLDVYEDAHWVDPSTLELLDLPGRAGAHPAGPGGAHLPPRVQPALDRLRARHFAARSTGLAGGRAPRWSSASPAARRCRSEVLEQIVAQDRRRAAVRRGADQGRARIRPAAGGGDRYALSGPLPPLAIPATLHDSLMARLDRLGAGQGGGADRRGDRPGVLPRAAGGGRALREASCRTRSTRLTEAELVFRRGTPPEATYSVQARPGPGRGLPVACSGAGASSSTPESPQVLEEQLPRTSSRRSRRCSPTTGPQAGGRAGDRPTGDRAGQRARRTLGQRGGGRAARRGAGAARALPEGQSATGRSSTFRSRSAVR